MLAYKAEFAGEKLEQQMLAALACEKHARHPAWPLPNMKEVKATDFWGHRSSWHFPAELWVGQMQIDGAWATLMLYWVDNAHLINGGYAVAVFSRRQQDDDVRYYEWRACAHEFTHRSKGNCWHEYTCNKCGKSYDVDSSG